MADVAVRNLDDGVQESFDFIVNGHTYRFTHMTTSELEAMQGLEATKIKDYICKFVSPVSEGAPEFAETLKNMIAPKLRLFMEMIKTEVAG